MLWHSCKTGATRSQWAHLLRMLHGFTPRGSLLISQLALQQALCLFELSFLPCKTPFGVLQQIEASVCCAMTLPSLLKRCSTV